jgi:hypothetical protein
MVKERLVMRRQGRITIILWPRRRHVEEGPTNRSGQPDDGFLGWLP